jgi:hypothetical protein
MTYEDVIKQIQTQEPDVTPSQMFGMPVLKIGRKAFCGEWHGDMVFKLDEGSPAHTTALQIPGAELFDPGMGKPMKEWVVVPQDQSEQWPKLALDSLEYVEKLAK